MFYFLFIHLMYTLYLTYTRSFSFQKAKSGLMFVCLIVCLFVYFNSYRKNVAVDLDIKLNNLTQK